MRPNSGYSLVVGVQTFKPSVNEARDGNSFQPLAFAEARARDVADALKITGHTAHVPAPVLDPSWTELSDHLKAVLRALGPDGVAVVHVISHGWLGARIPDLYVATTDGEDLENCMHVDGWLTSVENGDGYPRVVLLLDVCHAGAAAEQMDWRRRSGSSRRTWVLGAAMADQTAYGGRFSQAVSAVLDELAEDGLATRRNQPHVTLELFARRLKQKLAELCKASTKPWQDLSCTSEELGTVVDAPFFPNPGYIADPLELLRTERAKQLAGFLDSLDPILDPAHYLGKASGSTRAGSIGRTCHFTGRLAELRAVATWMGDHEAEPLCLVTGSAGTGKSALIGVQVCSAHPELRGATDALQSKIDDDARADLVPSFAAAHASRLMLDEIAAGIARQLHLDGTPPWTARGLITALQATIGELPLIVIDAVDEAARPRDLAEFLIIPLLRATRMTSPGTRICRLLIGCRPGSVLEDLVRNADVATRLIDLDRIQPQRLRDEVGTYLRGILASTDGFNAAQRQQISAQLASTLVDETVAPIEGRIGAFLGASLLAAQMSTPGDVTRLLRTPHYTLTGLVDQHLSQMPDPVLARVVLQAIASAEGDGVPRSLVETICASAGETARQTRKLVVEALRHTQPYWRSSAALDGTEVYRLSHRELVDHFRSNLVERS